MIANLALKLFSPKVLSVISLAGSTFSVTLGLVDGEPFSTLSFAGILVSITAAAILCGTVIADLQSRVAALDSKKEPS